MTLENFRAIVRAMVPGSKSSVIADTVLDPILNAGVVDLTAFCELLPTNKKFNAVADQGSAANPYTLSSALGDFLVQGGGGLWWNSGDGDSPKWKKLSPRTIEWLDENRPNWHEISSGSPEDYAIDGDNLYIVPHPSDSLSDGFWNFYTKLPTDMSDTGHYPFVGSTSKLSHLEIFDFAICYYARWKIIPMLGQDTMNDEFNRNQNLYVKERKEKHDLIRRRPDLDQTAKWQGPVIR